MTTHSSQTPEAPDPGAGQPELSRRTRNRIVTSATLGTLLDGADFAILIIFLVPIASYFDVSVLTVTLIHSSSYVAGIAGGILFGVLADRKGRRVSLAAAIATFSVFMIASAFSPSIWWLAALRVLAGIGIGGESGVAFALINEVIPGRGNRRGALSGVVQTMFIFGNVLALAVFAFTTARWGDEAWRWAFGILGAGGVVAFAVRYWMPESPYWVAAQGRQLVHDRTSSWAVLGEIMRPPWRARAVRSTLLMTAAFFGAYAVISFAPSMWLQTYDLPPNVVAHIGYAGSASAIAAYVLAGALSDYVGRRRAFLAFGIFGAVSYLLFALVATTGWADITAESYWVSPVLWVFLLVQFGYGYHGSQGVWLSEMYPTRIRATAQNLVYYVGRAVGAGLGPVLALSVAQSVGGDFRLAISLGVVGAAGTALMALTLPETMGDRLAL